MISSNQNSLLKDLVISILLLLPVKSLLRFKCVCKSWYATITSFDFISQHLNKNYGRLLVCYYTSPDYHISHEIFLDDRLLDLSHELFHLPTPFHDIFGPCNGIFCIVDKNDSYALWNPATKELRALPVLLSPPSLPPDVICIDKSCIFGIDPVTNNYKVVVIHKFSDEFTRYCVAQVLVHIFGTDFWKEIEFGKDYQLSLHEFFDQSPCYTYVNGVYYWLALHKGDYRILSFHMSNDMFLEIKVPHHICISDDDTIGLYDDSVALFHVEREKNIVEIWVMTKDGCWSKQTTVGPLLETDFALGYWKNNQLILGTTTGQFKLCDLNTQEIKNLGFLESKCCMRILIVKESLVSLNYGDKQLQPEEHY